MHIDRPETGQRRPGELGMTVSLLTTGVARGVAMNCLVCGSDVETIFLGRTPVAGYVVDTAEERVSRSLHST